MDNKHQYDILCDMEFKINKLLAAFSGHVLMQEGFGASIEHDADDRPILFLYKEHRFSYSMAWVEGKWWIFESIIDIDNIKSSETIGSYNDPLDAAFAMLRQSVDTLITGAFELFHEKSID